MAAPKKGKFTRERQDSLREWLSNKCTAQHLVDNLNKIEQLDPDSEQFTNSLAKYKTANEQRFKILDKYLPSIKPVEVTGEDGGAIELDTRWEIEFINAPKVD